MSTHISLIAALLTLAACGSDSSSAPKPLTAAQLAAHYDSLARTVGSEPTPFDTTFGKDIAVFNGIIADGQLPSSIQLLINGTPHTWFANFANVIAADGTDSVQLLLFWPSTGAGSFVALGVKNATTAERAAVATQGGDFLTDSADTFTGSFAVASGACTLEPITDTATVAAFTQFGPFTTYAGNGETCQPATATITATMNAKQTDTTVTADLQSLAVTQQTVSGVRLVMPSATPLRVLGRH